MSHSFSTVVNFNFFYLLYIYIFNSLIHIEVTVEKGEFPGESPGPHTCHSLPCCVTATHLCLRVSSCRDKDCPCLLTAGHTAVGPACFPRGSCCVPWQELAPPQGQDILSCKPRITGTGITNSLWPLGAGVGRALLPHPWVQGSLLTIGAQSDSGASVSVGSWCLRCPQQATAALTSLVVSGGGDWNTQQTSFSGAQPTLPSTFRRNALLGALPCVWIRHF